MVLRSHFITIKPAGSSSLGLSLLFLLLMACGPHRSAESDYPEDKSHAAQTLDNDSTTRLSIEEEMASFAVAKGFTTELYASEEQGVIKPTAMRWDEQGRLWVQTAPTYPQLNPGDAPGDRLIVLEDTNSDGRPDRSKVFVDHLNIPLGFELGNGGVYL